MPVGCCEGRAKWVFVNLSSSECPDTAFQAVPAATSYSTLAGLITGFVFTGIILLIADRRQVENFFRLPTLIQFFAGFVSLGFSAYVFGLISGEAPQACRRAWTAVAAASGMLAVGVIAAVGGIVLLAIAYRPTGETDRIKTQLGMFRRLLRTSYILTAFICAALLVGRNIEATWVWFGKDLWKIAVPLAMGLLVLGFGAITVRAWRYDSSTSRHHDRAPLAGSGDPDCQHLLTGAMITVLYTLIAALLVGTALSLVNGDWGRAGPAWGLAATIAGTAAPLAAIWWFVRGVLGLVDAWPPPTTSPDPNKAPAD